MNVLRVGEPFGPNGDAEAVALHTNLDHALHAGAPNRVQLGLVGCRLRGLAVTTTEEKQSAGNETEDDNCRLRSLHGQTTFGFYWSCGIVHNAADPGRRQT